MGLLFADPTEPAAPRSVAAKTKDKVKAAVPDPYAESSSPESHEEIEADLDEVAQVRRSLLRPKPSSSKPVSERAKKGWLAHQSVFPPSSSSSSSPTESDKETEDETDEDERSRMMGRSRQKTRSQSRDAEAAEDDEDVEGYMLSPPELYRASMKPPPYNAASDLEEPLLGPDELEDERDGRRGKVPVRLQVYHGRFGHWEREGLRKYKGEQRGASRLARAADMPRLWLPGAMVDRSDRRDHRAGFRLGVHRCQSSLLALSRCLISPASSRRLKPLSTIDRPSPPPPSHPSSTFLDSPPGVPVTPPQDSSPGPPSHSGRHPVLSVSLWLVGARGELRDIWL